jgi:cyclic 2,3-diphosphoglycerate synthetase
LRGRRALLALTAPPAMGAVLAQHLEDTTGVRIVARTHALSNRKVLREELQAGFAQQPDVVLTEIKAASIDVVAETAAQRGLQVGFLDNVPMAAAPGVDLVQQLEQALDLEALRARVRDGATRGVAG